MFIGRYWAPLFLNSSKRINDAWSCLLTTNYHWHIESTPTLGLSYVPLMSMRTQELFLEFHQCKRDKLFNKLKCQLSDITQWLQLHPCIFTAIWLGLLLIHRNSPYPNITKDILPQLIQPVQLQTRLGWEKIFHGHLSIMWASAIDTFHPNLAIMGEQVITAIWLYILAIWKLHNHHLHHMAESLNLPNYHQAAISLYERYHQIPPAAQEALFSQPIDTILELPGPQLQQWVKQGYQYFNQQIKAVKNEQPWTHLISDPSLVLKLSKIMISNPHGKPYDTEPVRVFFVCNNLREITLKTLSFLLPSPPVNC